MSAIYYTAIGAGEFTKELLDRNFAALSQSTILTDARLSTLENLVTDLSQTLFDTTKTMVEVVSKRPKRPSKIFLLGVVATGAYIGYKYAEAEFDDRRKKATTDFLNKKAATTSPSENGDKQQD